MAGHRGRRLRVGVVGCGHVGKIHARAYLANPDVEFVGMCDRNRPLAESSAASLNVTCYGSIAELVEKGSPEMASVAAGCTELVVPVAECLEAGVHVLCEKPVSFQPAEILQLVEQAERKGQQFGVNFNQRFTPASQWFRRLSEEGRFGRMLYTVAQYNQGARPAMKYYALREYMIHQLDFWRWQIGEVRSVTAQALWPEAAERPDNPDGLAATLVFENEALGVFANGFPVSGGLWCHYELVGSKGRGYCENFVGRAVFRPGACAEVKPAEVMEAPWLARGSNYWDTFATHLDLAVAARLRDEPMPVPAMAAFEAQCICAAIIQAIESGSCVAVQPVRQAIMGSAAASAD